MHDKEDTDLLEEIKEKEEEERTTFKSVINKRRLNDFEMDMLFFEDSAIGDKEGSDDE